jgi:hypothetical protein
MSRLTRHDLDLIFFLALTLPDFKSKILTQLSEAKKEDGPTLFNLMGQCFQDVGLTEWTNIVGKQCPQIMHLTKENFDECNWDYLEAVAGFLNISDQLIFWHCAANKPTFMPMHEFMRVEYSFSATLTVAIFIKPWSCPQHKKEEINLCCASQGASVQVCGNRQISAHGLSLAHSLF